MPHTQSNSAPHAQPSGGFPVSQDQVIQKIVFATDFSDCSRNAMRYAGWLANELGAELDIFHSLGLPVGNADSLVNPMSLLEKIAEDRLVELEAELEDRYPDHQGHITHHKKAGFPSENIVRHAEEMEADLLIVGAKGIQSGIQWLEGSTNGEVIRRAKCPVLAVPREMDARPIQHIVFAAELNPSDLPDMEPVIELARDFDAELSVLHVIPPSEHFSPTAYEEFKLEFRERCPLENVRFHLFETDQPSVTQAIQDYTGFEEADLIVMTTRPRSLLARLFQRSQARRMSLSTKVPLLILHPDHEK